MKNRLSILFNFLFFTTVSFSQNPHLTVQGSSGKFYLDHTVVAKENWYSIGRLYNSPPHDIAGYNNLNFDKALEIGQSLRIPLTPGNFEQKQMKLTGESLIPIYHTVQDKEWVFKISSVYNDVPITNIEKWNNIKRDDVKPGMNLIIGFLRVKTDLSPLASGNNTNPVSSSVVVTDPSNKTPKAADQPAQTFAKPASTQPSSVIPLTAASNTSASTGTDHVNSYALSHSTGGSFSVDFSNSGKTASGMAGTFKSTSGWSDGKYYALMNNVAVGTIIKVMGANGKIIFAKVLGQLPEMKESAGLIIRISNAASAELGLGEGKFPVDIKY
jgi:LysM repeat protein